MVSPLSSWKRGEATGSSRRSGPACALLASVNGRLGALAASSILRELTHSSVLREGGRAGLLGGGSVGQW